MFAEWEKKSDSLAGRRIWLVFVLTNQVGQSFGLLFLLAEISGQAVNETDRTDVVCCSCALCDSRD